MTACIGRRDFITLLGGAVAACGSRTTAASGYRYPEQPFAGD